MRFKCLALACMAFGALLTSCSDQYFTGQMENSAQTFRIVDFNDDDLDVFGEFPYLDEVPEGDGVDLESFSSCDEWAVFHNDGDDWRLGVTCAPWFDFDTMYMACPVNINYNDTEAGTVGGMFHHMHAQKPDGLSWDQAELDGVITCSIYLDNFSATDPDGDRHFDISFEYDGDTYMINDRRAEITNINDEGGFVYRVSFKAHDIPNDKYFAVYWQDDLSIAD